MRNERGPDRAACVCLLVGWLLPCGAAQAEPPAPVEAVGGKVRVILISFDRAGRNMVYERSHTQVSARVSDEALPKLAALRTGQVVELRLQPGVDGYPIVLDAKKPGNKVEYLLFLVGALIVQLIPGG